MSRANLAELAACLGWRPFTSNDVIAATFGALAGLVVSVVAVARRERLR